jgi:hypothetical protein
MFRRHKQQDSSPGWSRQKHKTLLEGWQVAQAAECLPSKHEALSSNPSTIKKNYIKKQNSTGKIPKVKRAEGLAQMFEHLPSKYEALSSHPSTTQKKKKKEAC